MKYLSILIVALCAACASTQSSRKVVVSKHHEAPLRTQYGDIIVTSDQPYWLVYSDGTASAVSEEEYNAARVVEE